MSKYLKNNIGFRRSSALQFMQFYNAKAFLLGEVLDGVKSDMFTPTAREILLQYFSAAERLLKEVEHELIACHGGLVTEQAIGQVEKRANEFVCNLHHIIKSNPTDFDPKFAAVWLDISHATAKPVLDSAKALLDGDITTAFSSLTGFTSMYLNHVMFVLHELLCLFKGDSPILYVGSLDIDVLVQTSFCLAQTRLSVYTCHGLLQDGAELKVLREVEEQFLRSDERKQAAYRALIDAISVYNVNVY